MIKNIAGQSFIGVVKQDTDFPICKEHTVYLRRQDIIVNNAKITYFSIRTKISKILAHCRTNLAQHL